MPDYGLIAKIASIIGGSPKSTAPSAGPSNDEMEKALMRMSMEMPEAVARVQQSGSLRPMSPASKLFGKVMTRGNGAEATTSPFGAITYDPEIMARQGDQPEDILAHELEHVNQQIKVGPMQYIIQGALQGYKPWDQRTFENEAEQRAASHMGLRRRLTDIPLKPSGSQ